MRDTAARPRGRAVFCANSKCRLDKPHGMRYNLSCVCGRSSSGRARPCQGRGSEFEPRRPLQKSPPIRVVIFFACPSARGFCAAKNRAAQARPLIERARETRQRFPLHTFPSLRHAGVQTTKPVGNHKKENHPFGWFFFLEYRGQDQTRCLDLRAAR